MQKQAAQRELPKNRLAELRSARGEYLWQLTHIAQRDTATINRWERNEGNIPDDAKLALAKHYGVSVPYLMGWDESEESAA